MNKFEVYTIETAPEASKPVLEKLLANVGAIPNLAATMAESSVLTEGFVTLRGIWQTSSFSDVEREAIATANAVVNNCDYCVAIHSTFALKGGIDAGDLELVRDGGLPAGPRLRALIDFARKLMTNRGQVSENDLEEFLSAGFTKAQALEVIVGSAVSVLANFANHLTHAPLDEFLKPQAWQAAA